MLDAVLRRARQLLDGGSRSVSSAESRETAAEILAEPRDDPDLPTDEELDAFIEAIYEARARDRDRARA
jgi:hypothetical protein